MSLALCIHSSSTSVIPWIQPNTRLHTPAELTTRKNSKYKSILAVQTCVLQRSTVGTPATLSPQGAWVQSLVRELRIHMLHGTAKKKKGQLHFSKVLACDPGQVHSLCGHFPPTGRKEQSPTPWPTPVAAGRIKSCHVCFVLIHHYWLL